MSTCESRDHDDPTYPEPHEPGGIQGYGDACYVEPDDATAPAERPGRDSTSREWMFYRSGLAQGGPRLRRLEAHAKALQVIVRCLHPRGSCQWPAVRCDACELLQIVIGP